MDTNRKWNRPNRLDSALNVLLIVLALGVMGVASIEVQIDNARVEMAAESA